MAIAVVGAIPPLVHMLGAASETTQCAAAAALRNLGKLSCGDFSMDSPPCGDGSFKKAIAAAGAIPDLVSLLDSSGTAAQTAAADALGSLACASPPNQVAIAAAGAIPRLVSLLRNSSQETQTAAAMCLFDLADENPANLAAITAAGGMPELQWLAQRSNDEDARQVAAMLVEWLERTVVGQRAVAVLLAEQERRAAAAAAELLAEEERQAAQEAAKAAAKTAKRQRQKERRRTAAAAAAPQEAWAEAQAAEEHLVEAGEATGGAGSAVPQQVLQQQEAGLPSPAPQQVGPTPPQVRDAGSSGSKRRRKKQGARAAAATTAPAPVVGAGASGTMPAAEQDVPLAAGPGVPEPAAADKSADSEAEAELAQLMREMGVSPAAAGAWGGAGPSTAAIAADLTPVRPASPTQHPLQPVGSRQGADGTSTIGSGRVAEAAARDALVCELLCPITREPMRDPVLAADGRTYERAAIEAWIAQQLGKGCLPDSPMTGEPLEHLQLAPNHNLRSIVASAAAMGCLAEKGPRAAWAARATPPKSLWRSMAALVLGGEVMVRILQGKVHWKNTLEQLNLVGPRSLGVCLLTAAFVGMVFTIQFIREFAKLGLTRSVGGVLALALSRELTPVVTSIIVAGRVSEQTDSLRVLGSDPVDYLITPRVLACMVAGPILTLMCFCMGMAASVLLADVVYDVSCNVILDSAMRAVSSWDIITSMIKSWVFGTLIATVSCSWGYTTTGGAKGVGESTTSAVVISLVLIFVFDFALSFLFFQGTGDALKQCIWEAGSLAAAFAPRRAGPASAAGGGVGTPLFASAAVGDAHASPAAGRSTASEVGAEARELDDEALDEVLFARIDRDLAPYSASGISLRMVEQAYCRGREQGFRLQARWRWGLACLLRGKSVLDGRLYVAGTAGEFQSRLLSVQRMLLGVARRWRLPDLDIVIEQSDWPSAAPVGADCPARGPVVVPAKDDADPNHAHALLAPDHTFAEWVETRTLSWPEMITLLSTSAADHPWETRFPSLFFRGAPTGAFRPRLAESVAAWRAAQPGGNATALPLDLVIADNIHEVGGGFSTLYDHCARRYLLQNGTHLWQLRLEEHQDPAAALADFVAQQELDPGAARRLGAAGRALALAALSPDRVQRYWRRLLGRYTALQTFRPERHPDAVPLEQALLARGGLACAAGSHSGCADGWVGRTCAACSIA
eukprot:scaffold24.g2971.t1